MPINENATPLTEDELVKFMTTHAEYDRVEYIYLKQGPGKHDQDDYNGLNYVEMNVNLLDSWLWDNAYEGGRYTDDDDNPIDFSPAYLGWKALQDNNVARRRVWEASGFHFGICGYEEIDVRRFFGQANEAEEKLEALKEWAHKELCEVEEALADMGDAENEEELKGMETILDELVKKLA